jgi:hypothetical protein
MHKLREISGCDFSKIRPFFDVFSRISPFGEHTKDDDQKISPCFRVSREFHRKRRSFSQKNAVFGKSRPTLPEKRREFFVANFCILKNRGIFSDFEFLKQPHYWTILKNTRKNLICDFLRKNGEGQKKAKFTFLKNRVFSQKAFLRFFVAEGLCQNEKIG